MLYICALKEYLHLFSEPQIQTVNILFNIYYLSPTHFGHLRDHYEGALQEY